MHELIAHSNNRHKLTTKMMVCVQTHPCSAARHQQQLEDHPLLPLHFTGRVRARMKEQMPVCMEHGHVLCKWQTHYLCM